MYTNHLPFPAMPFQYQQPTSAYDQLALIDQQVAPVFMEPFPMTLKPVLPIFYSPLDDNLSTVCHSTIPYQAEEEELMY